MTAKPQITDAEDKEEDTFMASIAKDYTSAFEATSETFMLFEPLTLTVRKDKGYSRAPHVGSEDFSPVKAYVGKRGKIIFVFKPLMAADYIEMEMDETQATKSLMGFKEFINDNLKPIIERVKEARIAESAEAERKLLENRRECYKDFASW